MRKKMLASGFIKYMYEGEVKLLDLQIVINYQTSVRGQQNHSKRTGKRSVRAVQLNIYAFFIHLLYDISIFAVGKEKKETERQKRTKIRIRSGLCNICSRHVWTYASCSVLPRCAVSSLQTCAILAWPSGLFTFLISRRSVIVKSCCSFPLRQIQSNFNSSNTFGTLKICSR